jgi:hypothetical protein
MKCKESIKSGTSSSIDFDAAVRCAMAKCSTECSTESLEKRTCPDQYVGLVSEIKEVDRGFGSRKDPMCRPGEQAVILVLESPHIEEFKDERGPAKGVTGRNIVSFIGEVLGLKDKIEGPLILMNAVQYQCSLGQPTKEYRDEVFTATWQGGGKEDFISRLTKIYRDGDTIICACTRGYMSDRKRHLRQLVYTAIQEAYPNATVLLRTHPAAWHWPANRIRVWNEGRG